MSWLRLDDVRVSSRSNNKHFFQDERYFKQRSRDFLLATRRDFATRVADLAATPPMHVNKAPMQQHMPEQHASPWSRVGRGGSAGSGGAAWRGQYAFTTISPGLTTPQEVCASRPSPTRHPRLAEHGSKYLV